MYKRQACILREKIDGKIDALSAVPAGRLNVARLFRAAAEDNGVKLLHKRLRQHVFTDIGVRNKSYAFGFHETDAAFDDAFIKLHVGYAVHQQAAYAVILFIHSDVMPPLIEHVGAGKSRRTGAYNRYLFAGAQLGRTRAHISLFISLFNYRQLIFLNGNGIVVYSAQAGNLAQRRTYSAGKFRKIVGFKQP